MLSPWLRWLLIAVLLGFAFVHGRSGEGPLAFVFGLGAVLLVVGHFRYGSVQAAFRAVARKDLARAQKLIEATRAPQLLSARHRSYFHWVHAALAEGRGDLPGARDRLQRVLALPLRSPNDRTLAWCTLARLHHELGDRDAARQALAEASGHARGTRAAALVAKLEQTFAR